MIHKQVIYQQLKKEFYFTKEDNVRDIYYNIKSINVGSSESAFSVSQASLKLSVDVFTELVPHLRPNIAI